MGKGAENRIAKLEGQSKFFEAILEEFDRIEETFVRNYDEAGEELVKIYSDVERAVILRAPELIVATVAGRMVLNSDALQALEGVIGNINNDVAAIMLTDGVGWVNKWAPFSHGIGIQRIQVTVSLAEDFGFTNLEPIKIALANFSEAEAGTLLVGQQRLIRIRNLAGEQIVDKFRQETIRAMAEGIPLVGPGDTFSNRLIRTGILKEVRIPTTAGTFRTISIDARARTIARTESIRIAADAEAVKIKELGFETFVFNRNPVDDRTSAVCDRAVSASPMTLETLDNVHGRPPRHPNCRCSIIAGRPEWFALEKAA